MSSKENFMLRAIELSINSAKKDGGPFGCVITKNGTIISCLLYTSDAADE